MTNLKTNKEVKEYNKSLFNITEEVKDIILLGPRLMIRLFKVYPQTSTGLLTSRFEKYETEGGRLGSKESDNQYQYRGVVVNISPDCSEKFKEKVSVGTVIDIANQANVQQGARSFEKHTLDKEQAFDNYFILSEHQIEWIWKTNPEDRLEDKFIKDAEEKIIENEEFKKRTEKKIAENEEVNRYWDTKVDEVIRKRKLPKDLSLARRNEIMFELMRKEEEKPTPGIKSNLKVVN